ncbi:MAG: DCC1-like thiol-disulfide oxidoreductase family protein [Pseudomonadota bacterium]
MASNVLFAKPGAALEILKTLRAPCSWLLLLTIVPRFLTDAVHDLIVRNRYNWCVKKDKCFLPLTEQIAHFVSGPSRSALSPNHR